jgi:hypothetical protein
MPTVAHRAFDAAGCVLVKRKEEDEAAFLSGALFVTEATLLLAFEMDESTAAHERRRGSSSHRATIR